MLALPLLAALLSVEEPFSDLRRFPPKECVVAALEFNRAYRTHIDMRRDFEPRNYIELGEVLAETDWCFACWSALGTAHGCYGDYSRPDGLQRLRTLLGESAYLAGRMPPCVPIWRMRSLD